MPDTGSLRTRGDKRVRTRERLLDAALALTSEKGFDRTTLQDIAGRAGMTTGAIYGNFRDRDALFMALAERQWAPIRPVLRRGASFADLMDAMAEAVIAAIPNRAPAAVGALTFRVYALTHPTARAAFRDRTAADYEAGARWLEAVFAADQLPMPADLLVRVIGALTEGLLLQRFLTPDLVPDAAIRAGFAALARRA